MKHKSRIIYQPAIREMKENFESLINQELQSIASIGTPKIIPITDPGMRSAVIIQWCEADEKDVSSVLNSVSADEVIEFYKDSLYQLLDRIGVDKVKEYFNLTDFTELPTGSRVKIVDVIDGLSFRAKQAVDFILEYYRWQYVDQLNDKQVSKVRNCGEKTVKEIMALKKKYGAK